MVFNNFEHVLQYSDDQTRNFSSFHWFSNAAKKKKKSQSNLAYSIGLDINNNVMYVISRGSFQIIN